MKYRNASDYSVKVGQLQNFAKLPSDFLELVRTDLGLKMPLSVLTGLQNYFKMNSCGNPDAAELILFDILRENSKVVSNTFISEIRTNDTEIAETYADMMQKFGAMYPKHTGPIPLDMLFTLAGKYLLSCMPAKNMDNEFFADYGDGRSTLPIEYASSAVKYCSEGGNFNFYIAKPAAIKAKAVKNASYYLISPLSQVTDEEKRSRLDRMLSEKVLVSSVLSVIPVRDGCISAVINDCPHATLDLSHFISSQADIPFAATVGQGDVLVVAIPGADSLLSAVSARYGFTAVRAGKRRKKGNFEFKTTSTRTFRAELLNKLLTKRESRLLSLTLPEFLHNEAPCSIKNLKLRAHADSHIICDEYQDEIDLGRENIRVLTCDYKASPYVCGRKLVSKAAEFAREEGVSLQDVRLTLNVSYDAAEPEKLFEFILGVYRAQIELCIPSENDRLYCGEDVREEATLLLRIPQKCMERNNVTALPTSDEKKIRETSAESARPCHVCLPILGGTGEINHFIAFLRDHGAECAAPFFGTSLLDHDVNTLAKILAETDILVLDGEECDKAFLTDGRILEAISSFVLRGGAVLAVGRAAGIIPDIDGIHRYEGGLSVSELEQFIHI